MNIGDWQRLDLVIEVQNSFGSSQEFIVLVKGQASSWRSPYLSPNVTSSITEEVDPVGQKLNIPNLKLRKLAEDDEKSLGGKNWRKPNERSTKSECTCGTSNKTQRHVYYDQGLGCYCSTYQERGMSLSIQFICYASHIV